MKTLLTLMMLGTALVGMATAQTADLYISEYVEGSGFNKALEIFNGTGDPVDLSQFAIDCYFNGSATSTTIPLPAVSLVPGDVFVITSNSADPTLLDMADMTHADLQFNGDDAVVLSRGLQVIDSIGQVGMDPGTAWTCPGGTTLNATLRRVLSFCEGDTQPGDPYNPCASFDFLPSDDFTGLGTHVSDCTSVSSGIHTWGSLKASYR
jgi:hypothetical protein